MLTNIENILSFRSCGNNGYSRGGKVIVFKFSVYLKNAIIKFELKSTVL